VLGRRSSWLHGRIHRAVAERALRGRWMWVPLDTTPRQGAGVHRAVAKRALRRHWAWGPQGTAQRRRAWGRRTSRCMGQVQSVAKGEAVVAPGDHIRFLIEWYRYVFSYMLFVISPKRSRC
jgi:hypothetical protein